MCLPLELVGERIKSRDESFDNKNIKSQFKWKLKFPKVEQLGAKAMKSWDQFKKWLVNNECHALCDFKELIVSKFNITRHI